MAVTLKQLAEELKLDHSTVAYALSGKGRIAAETRRRVIEAANRLGYVPNRLARGMRARRTNMIGLVLTDVVYSPYSEIVQHLLKQVADTKRELLIGLHQFDTELESAAVRRMLESQVDGLFIKATQPSWDLYPANHILRQAVAQGVPVVLYYTSAEQNLNLPSVDDPRIRGFALALEHLADLGHRRIAGLFPVPEPLQHLALLVKQAATEVCRRRGITLEIVCLSHAVGGTLPEYISQHNPAHALALGRELFAKAMTLKARPTAVIGFNDVIAIGAILEAQTRRLRVPEDVAISGCYRLPVSHLSPIPLTSCDTRPEAYAREMLALLDSRMEQPNGPVEVRQIEPVLVPGASTIGVGT